MRTGRYIFRRSNNNVLSSRDNSVGGGNTFPPISETEKQRIKALFEAGEALVNLTEPERRYLQLLKIGKLKLLRFTQKAGRHFTTEGYVRVLRAIAKKFSAKGHALPDEQALKIFKEKIKKQKGFYGYYQKRFFNAGLKTFYKSKSGGAIREIERNYSVIELVYLNGDVKVAPTSSLKGKWMLSQFQEMVNQVCGFYTVGKDKCYAVTFQSQVGFVKSHLRLFIPSLDEDGMDDALEDGAFGEYIKKT